MTLLTKGKPRGFAHPSWTPEKRRAVCSKGGKRAHELGVAHEYDAKEAKVAGRKGGLARATLQAKGEA